jgi:mitogen-activated protein kinase kinase
MVSKSSNLNSTADLKAAIDKISEPKEDNLDEKYKIKFREEDLSVMGALGAGAGGTVLKVIHQPTGLVLAKKVII